MRIEQVRDLIQQELYTPQRFRKIDKANEYPDPPAKDGYGIPIQYSIGIIDAVVKSQGFITTDKVDQINIRSCVLYGRLREDSNAEYLLISWDPNTQYFNQVTGIQCCVVNPPNTIYIEGPALGVTTTSQPTNK